MVGAVFADLLFLGLVEANDDDPSRAVEKVLTKDFGSGQRVAAGKQADIAQAIKV
ncbi:hypothetical protein D3C80_1911520 [compost metagenome]